MSADDRPIPPHFPRVTGRHQMTKTWAVTLPDEFARRIEDGDLVLWKKGLTCWIVVYDLKDGGSPRERLQWLTRDLPAEASQQWSDSESMPHRFAYLLREKEADGERWALYTFTVGTRSHVMMAIYFDRREDIEEARAIALSIAEEPEANKRVEATSGTRPEN